MTSRPARQDKPSDAWPTPRSLTAPVVSDVGGTFLIVPLGRRNGREPVAFVEASRSDIGLEGPQLQTGGAALFGEVD
jgi:hypothetical protein